MAMFVVGLTGQTGAGKSTVGRILQESGMAVIDCDFLARIAVEPGTDCLRELTETFGSGILWPDGSLNRGTMAAIAFPDPEKLAQLNRITHKAILRLLQEEIDRLEQAGEKIAIVDAPTLFQAGADRFCHSVVSVIAPQAMRFARILARDGMTEEAAKKRLAAQEEDSFYTDRSEFVIVNDGSLAELTEKTEALAQMLWRKAGKK